MSNNVYLENARGLFLRPPKDVFYEGMGSKQFDDFVKMLGYIVPNKLTPTELIVYLKFLSNDIRNRKCMFHNSERFTELFEQYLLMSGNLDVWMSYFPGFIEAFASSEFNNDFISLFKKSFYELPLDDSKKDFGCVEIDTDVIDISNKDKAEVLAALYNHSKPVGMGMSQYDPTPMPVDVAREILKTKGYSFGYIKGRTMKINLSENIIYVYRYNADNNQPGLAQKAISTCRNIEPSDKAKEYKKITS